MVEGLRNRAAASGDMDQGLKPLGPPYGLELEAGTLIAFANGLLPASLKLGAGTKILVIEGG